MPIWSVFVGLVTWRGWIIGIDTISILNVSAKSLRLSLVDENLYPPPLYFVLPTSADSGLNEHISIWISYDLSYNNHQITSSQPPPRATGILLIRPFYRLSTLQASISRIHYLLATWYAWKKIQYDYAPLVCAGRLPYRIL